MKGYISFAKCGGTGERGGVMGSVLYKLLTGCLSHTNYNNTNNVFQSNVYVLKKQNMRFIDLSHANLYWKEPYGGERTHSKMYNGSKTQKTTLDKRKCGGTACGIIENYILSSSKK